MYLLLKVSYQYFPIKNAIIFTMSHEPTWFQLVQQHESKF